MGEIILETGLLLLAVAVGLGGLLGTPWLAWKLVRSLYRLVVRAGQYPSQAGWSQAVQALDFLDAGKRVMAGTIRGESVRIEETWVGPVRRSLRMTIDLRDRLSPDFDLAPASLVDVVGPGFTLGDAAFQKAVRVDGSDSVLYAALSKPAREAVLELAASGFVRVHESVIEFEPARLAYDQFPRLVDQMVRVVERLSTGQGRPRALASTLAANIAVEPEPEVRLRALRVLLREYPHEEEAMRACEGMLQDASSELRLIAAAHLGGERGCAVLRRMVEDLGVYEEFRATALDELARLAPLSALADLVSRQLAAQEEQIRFAALRAVGTLRAVSLMDTVCALALTGPRDAEAAAYALDALGDARAETTLLLLLEREEGKPRVAAAAALGSCGTVRAVQALLECAQKGGAVAEAAQASVRRIQGRLVDAGAGRIAVVAPAADAVGAVSVAAGQGELSLVPEKKG